MVIVVQTLPAGEPGEQADIGRAVPKEVLPTPPVPEPVYGGRQHEDVEDEVRHRHCEPQDRSEERHSQSDTRGHSDETAVEEEPVPHVVLDVLGPASDCLGVFRLADVVEDVAELYSPEAVKEWAMRVALFVGEGVVLPVNRHPFPPVLAG